MRRRSREGARSVCTKSGDWWLVTHRNTTVKKRCNAYVCGSDVPRSIKAHYYSLAVEQLRSIQGLAMMSIASLVQYIHITQLLPVYRPSEASERHRSEREQLATAAQRRHDACKTDTNLVTLNVATDRHTLLHGGKLLG